jgi:hypothetical protein
LKESFTGTCAFVATCLPTIATAFAKTMSDLNMCQDSGGPSSDPIGYMISHISDPTCESSLFNLWNCDAFKSYNLCSTGDVTTTVEVCQCFSIPFLFLLQLSSIAIAKCEMFDARCADPVFNAIDAAITNANLCAPPPFNPEQNALKLIGFANTVTALMPNVSLAMILTVFFADMSESLFRSFVVPTI